MFKVSSNSTLFSIERAANEAGVSHQTLRNWLRAEVPVARPTFWLNRKQPLYSPADVQRLKAYVQSNR